MATSTMSETNARPKWTQAMATTVCIWIVQWNISPFHLAYINATYDCAAWCFNKYSTAIGPLRRCLEVCEALQQRRLEMSDQSRSLCTKSALTTHRNCP